MAMKEFYECFEVSVGSGVAHIQLNRSDKANSLTRAFWSEFPELLWELHRSGVVRACVLSARGEVFCGGLDLSMFTNAPEFFASTAVEREAMALKLLQMQEAISTIESVRFPVIAAVQGACIGGGFDLVAACDVILASQDASFRIEETNIGMMADLGILQRLPHLISPVVARQLAFTGRTLRSDEAHRLGLIVDVFEDTQSLHDGAMQTAAAVSQKSPVAIASIKRSFVYGRDHGVKDALEHAAHLQAAVLSGEDIVRTFQAAKQADQPVYDSLKTLSKEF